MNSTLHDGEHFNISHNGDCMDRNDGREMEPWTHLDALTGGWQYEPREFRQAGERPLQRSSQANENMLPSWEYSGATTNPTGLSTDPLEVDGVDWPPWQYGSQADAYTVRPWDQLSATVDYPGPNLELPESEQVGSESWQRGFPDDDYTLSHMYGNQSNSISSINSRIGSMSDHLFFRSAGAHLDDVHTQSFVTPSHEPRSRRVSRSDQYTSTPHDEPSLPSRSSDLLGLYSSSLIQTDRSLGDDTVYRQPETQSYSSYDDDPLYRQVHAMSPYSEMLFPSYSETASSIYSGSFDLDSGTGPDVLTCHSSNCNARFTGKYRRGNLARHERHRHHRPKEYACEHDQCPKVFKRQDARLKHYQRYHTELIGGKRFPRELQQKPGPRIPEGQETRSDEEQSKADFSIGIRASSHSEVASCDSMSDCGRMSPYSNSEMLSEPQATLLDEVTQHSRESTVPSEYAHSSNAAEDNRVICDLCESTFQRPADLRRHKQKHGGPSHACELPGCDRKFYRIDKLRDHMRQGHKTDTYEAFLDLDTPQETPVSTSSSFRCGDCSEVFQTAGQLTKHVNRKHIRRFACNNCTAAFHLNADLKRHQETVHRPKVKETHPCSNEGCTQTFARRDNLARHKKLCKHAPDMSVMEEPD